MPSTADIIVGILIPAVVCAAILLAAWRPWPRAAPPDGRWAGAIAIGAAYAIAYAKLVGDFQFPPTSADNWIVYLMPAAMIGGLLFCLLPLPPWSRVVAVAGLAVALVWLLLKPLIGSDISGPAAAGRIAAGAVAMTVWWVLINQLARHGPRMLAPLVLLLAAAGGAVILGDNGLAQRGGEVFVALAAILAACAVVSAITPRFRLAGGGTLAAALALFGTMLYGYYYIYPDPTPRLIAAMALVPAAPLLAWAAWLPGLRSRTPWIRGAAAVILVVLGVGAAIALAELPSHQPVSSETDVP